MRLSRTVLAAAALVWVGWRHPYGGSRNSPKPVARKATPACTLIVSAQSASWRRMWDLATYTKGGDGLNHRQVL